MMLPDYVVTEVSKYFNLKEVCRLRLVCKEWDQLLVPEAFKTLTMSKSSTEKYADVFEGYLEKHGLNTKSLIIKGTSKKMVSTLSSYCNHVTSLSVEFEAKGYEQDQEVQSTLELASNLPNLKEARFIGNITPIVLRRLQPIMARVSSLYWVARKLDLEGPFGPLDGIYSDSVKLLVFVNLGLDSESAAQVIMNFKYAFRHLSHVKFLPEHPSTNSLYNFKSGRYDIATFFDPSLNFNIELGFKPDQKPKRLHYPVATSDDFEFHKKSKTKWVLEDLRYPIRYTTKLPPILYARIHFPQKERWMYELIANLTGAEHLAIEMFDLDNVDYIFPRAQYKTKSLCLKVKNELPDDYFKWILDSFPNLQDLYIPENSAFEGIFFGKKKLNSLRRVFSYHDHDIGFWNKMVQSCPNLFQINLPADSKLRQDLSKWFPDILFGEYSEPFYYNMPYNCASIYGEKDGLPSGL